MKYQTILLLAAFGVSANAAVVSINLTNGDGPRQIGGSESTGVIATTGWHNISSATLDVGGTGINVTPSEAAGTTNTLRDSGSGDGTDGFLALYEAGLRDSGAADVTTVTIANMTAYLAAQSATEYRIIAYYKSPITSGTRSFRIRVGATAGTGSYVTTNTPDFANMSASDTFVELGGADNNWMQFTGLTSDTAVIEIDRVDRDGSLVGFQIETIAVPEPSSATLFGLGCFALTLRRRK